MPFAQSPDFTLNLFFRILSNSFLCAERPLPGNLAKNAALYLAMLNAKNAVKKRADSNNAIPRLRCPNAVKQLIVDVLPHQRYFAL